ncbi:MAG: hypothetical protein JWL69_2570 [Phycisphaerales bacterium]|nr:hypothetical protein [Phycisphaerales bacterium]
MVDRLLANALNLVVVSLITIAAGGAVILAYRGLLILLNGHVVEGLIRLGIAPAFGLATYLLIRNKSDLEGQ